MEIIQSFGVTYIAQQLQHDREMLSRSTSPEVPLVYPDEIHHSLEGEWIINN